MGFAHSRAAVRVEKHLVFSTMSLCLTMARYAMLFARRFLERVLQSCQCKLDLH